MPTATQPPAEPAAKDGVLARLGRDTVYVLPGFFIAIASFAILLTLFTVGVSTLVVWVGVLILPLVLVIASGFADISRARLRAWGEGFAPVRYRPRESGIAGWVRTLADTRRWLDFVFECLIAFPLRIATFTVAVTWWALALGGLTYAVWGFSIPDPQPWPQRFLTAITGGTIDPALAANYLVHVLVYFVIGMIALVTLPLLMRGLAMLDAAVTKAALTGAPSSSVGSAGLPGVGGAVGAETRSSARVSAADASSGPADGLRERPANVVAAFAGASHAQAAGERAAEPQTFAAAERDAMASSVSPEGWAWIAAGVIGVLSLSIGWPVLSAVDGIPVVFSMIIALMLAGSALLAVRWAWPAIALVGVAIFSAALLIALVGGSEGTIPVPVIIMLMHFLILGLVTLLHGWVRGALLWLAALTAPIGAFAVLSLFAPEPGFFMEMLLFDDVIANLIVVASVGAGVLAVASAARALLVGRASLVRERQLSAEEAAKRREIEERNRIAQELHDVVAHSMSVISVQATTAQYRIDGLDEQVRGEFDSIAESSRRALTEMRGLLSLLRTDRDAALAPQPELADLAQLVEATRRSGAAIDFEAPELAALASEVPAATGLTAYRIVQEGLSNAVRHAPGADVRVEVAHEVEQLRIRVVNGTAAQQLEVMSAPGSGLGLSGLRARVAALGGTLSAEPEGDGGFLLEAALPIR